MKRLLIALAASMWGLVVFRIALGIHFPTDALKNKVAVEVAKSTKDSMQLKMGDVGLTSLLGIQITDGILYTTNEQGESTPSFVLDTLSVVLSPLSTLMGSLDATIDAKLMGGTVVADISGDSFQPSSVDLTVDSSAIDLSLFPVASPTFEALLAGKLTTHIEGNFPQEKPHKNSEGRFSLSVDGLSISDAKASGIELPALDFSEVTIAGLFNNGKLEITDANIISDSIGLTIDGDIILGKIWTRSRLRLTLELQLGSEFALIAKMLPALKNNKVGDEDGKGIYKLNVIGTVQNPRIKTNNRNSSRRPSRNQNNKRNKSQDIEKDNNSKTTKSPEEKRRERRERIEARKRAQEKRREAGGFDLPDNPRRDLPNRPLKRVPALEPDEEFEDEEEILEPGDDIEEEEEDFDPGEEEPSEEPADEEDE